MNERARVIRVKGTGSIKLRPDMTCITMTVKGTYKEYSEAIKHSAQDTEALAETLAALGFDRESLKTLSFNIDERYEGYNDKNGNWRQRFMGYEFRHMLKLTFMSDNELLGRALSALAKCPVDPEINLSYTISDKERAKNLLLANAVKDAMAKASLLTEAAGVALGEIVSIDYSWGEAALEVPAARMALAKNSMADMACEESCGLNINPDDIRAEDTVTVVWSIA